MIFFVFRDGNVFLWDVPTQTVASKILKTEDSLTSIQLLDEKTLLAASTGKFYVADFRNISENPQNCSLPDNSCVNCVTLAEDKVIFGCENGAIHFVNKNSFCVDSSFLDSNSSVCSLQ